MKKNELIDLLRRAMEAMEMVTDSDYEIIPHALVSMKDRAKWMELEQDIKIAVGSADDESRIMR